MGWRRSSADELAVGARRVVVTDHHLTVDLEDGRTISVPLTWYPRLLHGTPAERADYEIDAYGISWPRLDADVSIKGLLLGHASGESQASFGRWLEHRKQGRLPPVEQRPLPDWARQELDFGNE